MPREYAATNLSIWQDDDWRRLPAPAQHLYLVLQTHPELSYCGVADWRPGRLVGLASGWSRADIETLADCLEARYFIVRDEVSEEVLVRSWIRFDGVIRQPRLAVSMANAFAVVSSNDIRGVIVHELQKVYAEEPEAGGWGKPQVGALLSRDALDPRSRTVPTDPFGQGFAYRFGQGFGQGFGQRLDETLPKVSVPVSVPPTPAPAPAPFHQHPVQTPDAAEKLEIGRAADIVKEWIDDCGESRPPRKLIGQVRDQIQNMLDERIDPDRIRAGVTLWRTKPHLGPSLLPNLVHEAATAKPLEDRKQVSGDVFNEHVVPGEPTW